MAILIPVDHLACRKGPLNVAFQVNVPPDRLLCALHHQTLMQIGKYKFKVTAPLRRADRQPQTNVARVVQVSTGCRKRWQWIHAIRVEVFYLSAQAQASMLIAKNRKQIKRSLLKAI